MRLACRTAGIPSHRLRQAWCVRCTSTRPGRPVPIAANGARLGSRDGIEVVRHTVPGDEVVVLHGIRCTCAERALFDEMRSIGEVTEMAIAVGAACVARLTPAWRLAPVE